MSSRLCLSANDKDDNEMIPGAVHRRKPRKTSAMRQSDEGCAISHRLRCGPLLPNKVGGIAQLVRTGEGRKEEKEESRKVGK